MGPMYIVDPHPNISKILRHLAPGEVSRPIQIDKWFVVLKWNKESPQASHTVQDCSYSMNYSNVRLNQLFRKS